MPTSSITRTREVNYGLFGDVAEFVPDAIERISTKTPLGGSFGKSDQSSSKLESLIKAGQPKKKVDVFNDDYLMNAIPEPRKSKRSASLALEEENYDDDNYNGGFGNEVSSGASTRRKAPEERMNDINDTFAGEDDFSDEDDGDDFNQNVFEKFSKKKKEYLAEKKSHYSAAPRYGGIEETISLDDSGARNKRGATYEMIKNKGLTPHRKTLNRNPRVKKRVMYERAMNKRKSAGHNVVSAADLKGGYEGQKTGINARVVKSRKIGN